MIKARYIHPDNRDVDSFQLLLEYDCYPNLYLTRTEAVVLKMQLEEIIKKIDGERK